MGPGGNPNWKKGGPSPNPSGRPAEHGVAKVKLASQIIDSATDILDVMIKKAKEGDSSAAQLVLSRIMAPLKASGERVRFSFDPSLPLSEQLAGLRLRWRQTACRPMWEGSRSAPC
ncbi:MAG: hypothetical protein IPF96_10990 [Rhodobacter sp.]|nr:hypothetical protein [Rhodobacter sp.]